MTNQDLSDVRKFHDSCLIIDSHCDTLGRVLEGRWRLGERTDSGQFDLIRAKEGGLNAILLAIFANPSVGSSRPRQALRFVDAFYQELEANPNLAVLAKGAKDIEAARMDGKIALMLSMEGAEGLEGDIRVLRVLHRLGLRMLGFTWNWRNEAADGLDEARTGGGLTRFGRALVEECNELGIVLDVAHLSPAGIEDALETSQAPVVSTHSNAYAVWRHPRNLTDKQLEAIAATGGVVGVTPVPPFLGEDENRGNLSTMLDHVDHMVSVMGDDGVALGLDFDGVEDKRVVGLEDVSRLPNLTAGLLERGYPRDTIQKILGGNLLRVFRQVLGA